MPKSALRSYLIHIVPLLTLIILLPFTYAHFFIRPYPGFSIHPVSGEITAIYTNGIESTDLQVGDFVIMVDSIPWKEFSLEGIPFGEAKPTQQYDLIVQRDQRDIPLTWTVLETSYAEIVNRIFEAWWVAYIFWFAGTFVILYCKPRDSKWLLLGIIFYLFSIWIAAGTVSGWNIWISSNILHTAFWLMVPLFMHLHWLIPKPLERIPIWILYVYPLAMGIAFLDWMGYFLPSTYLIGGITSFWVALILLIVHFVRQPEYRKDILLLVALIGFAVIPSIILAFSRLLQHYAWMGTGVLLPLIVLPWVYIFFVYRKNLAVSDIKLNSIFTIYLFIILLSSIFLISGLLVENTFQLNDFTASLGLFILSGILGTIITLVLYTPFRQFVDHYLLGMPYSSSEILETYSSQISTSLDKKTLIHTLETQILPILRISQSALLQLNNPNQANPLITQRVPEGQLPDYDGCMSLVQNGKQNSKYSPSRDKTNTYKWIRYVFPLKLDNKLIGVLLLGERDENDPYTEGELNIIQAVADQTTIALHNIEQTDILRALYRSNVNLQETERKRLAIELHDDVLGQIALILMNSEKDQPSNKVDDACKIIAARIRDIVNGLRPEMLSYGLATALEDLVDSYRESRDGDLVIQYDLDDQGFRHPDQVELHLYRIVQQACQNAVRHAYAHLIQISGSITSDQIELSVTDDGQGFYLPEKLDFSALTVNHHLGLIGMHERAEIICANLQLKSTIGRGTQVLVRWKSNSLPDKTIDTIYPGTE